MDFLWPGHLLDKMRLTTIIIISIIISIIMNIIVSTIVSIFV